MLTYLLNGSSSLLFIISTTKAFYCSKFILWKITNLLLIIASFLCNATRYNQIFLFIDYLSIFSVCLSYINNKYINSVYIIIFIYEYKNHKSIENIKNIALTTAASKSIINTYLYADKYSLYLIVISCIVGVILYKIRYSSYQYICENYLLLTTFLFHICIMNILYIASITA